MAAVLLNRLSDMVGNISARLAGTVFMLYDRNQVMAHPNLIAPHPDLSRENPTIDIRRVGDPVLDRFWSIASQPLRLRSNAENVRIGHADVAGKRYVFLSDRINTYGDVPWIIGGYVEAEILGRAFHAVWNSLKIGLFILLIGIGLAIMIGRAIARPVKAASVGIASIADLEVSEVKELPRSRLTELDAQAVAFNTMLGALRWFETYVPRSLVRRLIQRGEQQIVSEERDLTVLFTDIVGFTATSENMSAAETAALLNDHFELLGSCVEEENGTTDKFIGDALMAFWGAPDIQPDHADRALRAVRAMA